MRIVFLHHANVVKAGIERILTMKANRLATQTGCEVVMLTYEQNGMPYPYPLAPSVRCVDLGIRLYDAFKVHFLLRQWKRKQLKQQLARAIRHFLDEFRPDIVVCTDKGGDELKALLSVRGDEKLVIEAHTGMIDHHMQVRSAPNIFKKLLAWKSLRALQKSIARFDALIALTDDDARQWSPFVKSIVIPNYLPSYPAKPANLATERKRVISVGRLNFQKGQDLLLEAWQQVEAHHPDWKLDIYGDGAEQAALTAQCAALQLKGVCLHPSTPNIYAEYAKSDFLVCSSRWESFGLILIEAMSCGIPVVSFNCDNGPRNIIDDGQDGLLAANGDTADLASKMLWLIEHPEQRMAMGGRAYQNAARFREEVVFTRYEDFYHSLVQEQS